MRFIKCVFLIIIIHLSLPLIGQANANLSISAQQAILMEESTGRVLYEKNAHEIASIASITKIMTAIIAIESGKIDDLTRASHRAVHTEGSSIYLEQGEKMRIEDLIYGLMLRSGNDAAVAISEHIAGSVEGFVYLMNEKAQWLGMTNTNFENPHGLDADHHYSTAYDMALLLKYAMSNEKFKKISSTVSYQAKSRSYSWHNKNKLLTSLYEYCTGGKTGYTKKTGRTLSTSASKKDLNLIAVTLNAPDDWRDHIQMYEWGFKTFKFKKIMDQGFHDFLIPGETESITGFINSEVHYPLTKEENDNLNHHTFFFSGSQHRDNQRVGKTIVNVNDNEIIEIPIFHSESNPYQTNYLTRVIHYLKKITGVF